MLGQTFSTSEDRRTPGISTTPSIFGKLRRLDKRRVRRFPVENGLA